MNQETCQCDKKKCWLMTAIVLVVSGLIAWSLISLYRTPNYESEEVLAPEELGPEETAPAQEAAPLTEGNVTKPMEQAPAQTATPAPTVPTEKKKAK